MVLDATVAGASANSYLTVADADAMAANDLGRFATGWTEAPLDQKEKALIRASREIADRYGPTLPYVSTQALPFPRSTDIVGTPSAAFLHAHLKRATYEQAIFLIDVAEQLDDAAARRAQGTFSASDDSGSYSLATDPQLGRIAPEALAAIVALRGSRASSPRIVSVPLSSSYPP